MDQFNFAIGAQVHCQDGEAGKLTYVVTNPDRRVTYLIVERGIPLINKEARVVPFSTVESTTEEGIWLSLQKDQVADYDQYKETTVETAAPGGGAGADFSAPGGGYGNATTPAIRSRLRQGVPADSYLISHQTEVKNLHRTIGNVDRLLVDPKEAVITGVVVRKGLLRSDSPILSADMIEELSEKIIFVSPSSNEIESLPRHTG